MVFSFNHSRPLSQGRASEDLNMDKPLEENCAEMICRSVFDVSSSRPLWRYRAGVELDKDQPLDVYPYLTSVATVRMMYDLELHNLQIHRLGMVFYTNQQPTSAHRSFFPPIQHTSC